MNWTIDAKDWARNDTSPILDGSNPLVKRPSLASVVSMSLGLTTAGRLGFFIDYSELATVGDHTFYLTRTHGSTGVVGCTWTAYDSADGSQLATGNASWADQSLDVLSFTVNVPSKPLGDHRIYVLLSNPTGGAALHHGIDTVAYGIIDDDTIATSNAIFIDADAVTNGVGTEASPYNNWYSARDTVTVATKYIYIKGLMIPDTTDTVAMSNTVNHLALKNTFEGRTNESQRLIIRNWPTFTGGIDGGGQANVAGFAIDGASSSNGSLEYISFRRLSGTNLDNTTGGISSGKCYFLRTRGGSSGACTHITTERINIDGVISGANAAVAVWFNEGCANLKMWRWTVANTSHAAVDRTYPLLSFECFRTENVSIQCCTIEQTAGGFYEKEGVELVTKVGMSVRFNHLKGAHVRFSTQGVSQIQDFHIIQNNIFDTMFDSHSFQPVRFDMIDNGSRSTKTHISNNVFYNYDFSTYGMINVSNLGFQGIAIYNNIHYLSKRPIRFNENVDSAEYIDYDHYEYDGLTAPTFRYLSASESSLSALQSTTSFAINSTIGDPLFTSDADGDFTLQASSPALTSGVSGTQKGVYLDNFITVGAN
jgi:hypothetical protein